MLANVEKIIILLLLINCARKNGGEIFSSLYRLENLAINHKILIEELQSLTNDVNDDYLRSKLETWKKEQSLIDDDLMHYITNPLNAYLLIKRATSDIKLLEQLYPQQSKMFFKKVREIPEHEDLAGAVEGLLRLQFMYKLKTVDFANGIIDGQVTRDLLSPHDLFVIGEEALSIEYQELLASEYLEMVWIQINEGQDIFYEVDQIKLLYHLANLFNRVGYYQGALAYVDILLGSIPESKELQTFKDNLEFDLNKHGSSRILFMDPFSDDFIKDGQPSYHKEGILYSQVCRGVMTQPIETQSKLYCRYLSNNPFTTLAPFKVEDLNLDPKVVLFVDVVSEAEIHFLKEKSKTQVKRAVTEPMGTSVSTSSLRVAQNSWHYDIDHEVFAKISRRIEDMTGLTQETAEPLQVQNYGIGGHYAPHFDHRIKRDKPFGPPGNRIATVLLYLSDVVKGGETVFPYVKARVPVRKGSAAFWHNLKPSGESDYFTKHAGCPVLLGEKWVANKWIREHGQEFRRPCLPENFVEEPEEIYHKDFF